jgi:fucose permease
MAKETQSVGLSMTMLCMTLCFIYVVFFGMHGENLQLELDALKNQE